MIDVCLARFFLALLTQIYCGFLFSWNSHIGILFAVLFSFQRTIALSDLISLSRHFSFVKQIFLFFYAFFVPFTVWPTADIILPFYLSSVKPVFSDFIGIFVSAHTCFFVSTHTCPFRRLRRHLPRQSGDGFSVWVNSSIWGSAYISIFPFLLTLPPFVSSANSLAKAKRLTHFYSAAPLLEKWFACFP